MLRIENDNRRTENNPEALPVFTKGEGVMLRAYAAGRDDARFGRPYREEKYTNEILKTEYIRGYDTFIEDHQDLKEDSRGFNPCSEKGKRKVMATLVGVIAEISANPTKKLTKSIAQRLDWMLDREKLKLDNADFIAFENGVIEKCGDYEPRDKQLLSNPKVSKILKEAKVYAKASKAKKIKAKKIEAKKIEAEKIEVEKIEADLMDLVKEDVADVVLVSEPISVSSVKPIIPNFSSSSSTILSHLNIKPIAPIDSQKISATNEADQVLPLKKRKIGDIQVSSISAFQSYKPSIEKSAATNEANQEPSLKKRRIGDIQLSSLSAFQPYKPSIEKSADSMDAMVLK